MLLQRIDELGGRIVQVVAQVPILYQYLLVAEEKSGVKRGHIATAIAVALAMIVLSSSITSDAIGTLYPLYMSIKAIESRSMKHALPVFHSLLTYWMLFFSIKLFEEIFQWLVDFIPFYTLFKILFFIWAYHPTTRGSTTILTTIIRPYITEHALWLHTLVHDGLESAKTLEAEQSQGTYYLNCVISQVVSPEERCLQCEVLITDSEDPSARGFLYTTHELEGKNLAYNYPIHRHAVVSLKGFLEITVVEIRTFGANRTLGSARFDLCNLTAGARQTVALSVADMQAQLQLELCKDV